MGYEFPPLSDDELDDIVVEGDYNFEVIKSERKMSKAGNPMAQLRIKFWDNNDKPHTVFDYLVFSHVPLNIKKISRFCKSVGLDKEYAAGCLPDDLFGYGGKVKIGIQEESMNPNGGFYPKKNIVIDYLKKVSHAELVKKAEAQSFLPDKEFDDEIPF